jgi:hypothetical protein
MTSGDRYPVYSGWTCAVAMVAKRAMLVSRMQPTPPTILVRHGHLALRRKGRIDACRQPQSARLGRRPLRTCIGQPISTREVRVGRAYVCDKLALGVAF